MRPILLTIVLFPFGSDAIHGAGSAIVERMGKNGGMAFTASRILRPCVGLTLSLVLVSGCASDDPGISVLTEPDETVMAAEIHGELSLDADGCVRIGEDFALWPKGTKRSDDGVEVGERHFLFGERVRGSGGYVGQESAASMIGLDAAYEMERCTEREEHVAVLMLID